MTRILGHSQWKDQWIRAYHWTATPYLVQTVIIHHSCTYKIKVYVPFSGQISGLLIEILILTVSVIGIFDKRIPILQDIETRKSKRGHVLAELLETERIYVAEMGSILKVINFRSNLLSIPFHWSRQLSINGHGQFYKIKKNKIRPRFDFTCRLAGRRVDTRINQWNRKWKRNNRHLGTNNTCNYTV